MRAKFLLSVLATLILAATSCKTSGPSGESALETESSSPLNQKESLAYQKALLRCYKQGGSRIVKIQNELRCF